MSSLPSADQLAEAGREQLGQIHRLGVLLANVGAQQLDRKYGTLGAITSEVDKFTAGVGRTYATAGLVPTNYRAPSPPPALGVVLGVFAVGAAGLVAVSFLVGRSSKRGGV